MEKDKDLNRKIQERTEVKTLQAAVRKDISEEERRRLILEARKIRKGKISD
jgi:hypothetical protein